MKQNKPMPTNSSTEKSTSEQSKPLSDKELQLKSQLMMERAVKKLKKALANGVDLKNRETP